MAQLINLNKIRKLKAREQAAQQAAENRVRFGRSKAQKEADAAATQNMESKLDQIRRQIEPE
ncbi:MAG: DUF4169 family protein [Panacagrimonas sp.]